MPPSKPAAAGKRLEDDELFKQIGGQLDGNFDYSQWQRTGKPDAKPKPKKAAKDANDNVLKGKPSFMVSGGTTPLRVPAGLGRSHGDEDTCHHGKPVRKQTVTQAAETALNKKKAEQIKLLNLRIRARKQTLAEYRKREAELLLSNMKMKDEIDDVEKIAHDDVKKLLRKYEKYRGGINVLNEQFVEDLEHAKTSLDLTSSKVNKDIAVLQGDVDEVDGQLKSKQQELHVLHNYKDKEYPVKALRISELQTEIAELELNQEDEHQELQHIVETEIGKLKQEEHKATSHIREKITEELLGKMHPSLRDMAIQNIVMAKEIEFHTKEIGELEDKNKDLDGVVKGLLCDPKTNIRQQMFPEFYPNREKCTPDMEVVLDIPVQEWLPI